MRLSLEKVKKELELTEFEQDLLADSKTAQTDEINYTRNISELYLAISLDEIADKIILSNKNLAASQDKYANKMFLLTLALVFVGVVQIIIETLKFLLAR
jgi:hypothetical protein